MASIFKSIGNAFSHVAKPVGQAILGTPARTEQTGRFTPEQESVLSQLLQQGFGSSSFAPQEQQARQGFMQNTVPSLAERFTEMGGGAGGQRSSAFQGALGQAGAGLESSLAALRSQHGMQQMQMGLTPRFESSYFPAQGGMLQQGMQGMSGMLPGLMSLLMG